MELDPQMFDTYKRYKAGTSKVMAWLASKLPESMQDRFSDGSTATSTVPKEPDHDLKPGKHIGDLCNRFAFLEIEEPTSWTSTAVSNKTNKPIYGYEIKKTEEDTSFAIYCLFKDLTDIRQYVRQTWAEYREHCITFTTAALVSNTAIALFRRLTREFVSEFPQFEDHGAIIKYCSPTPHDKDSQDFAIYTGGGVGLSSRTLFCHLTYEFLKNFFMAAKAPFYQEIQGVSFRLSQEEEMVFKCLSLLGLLAMGTKGDFYNDQLIHGLYTLKTENPGKKIYTWVVLAVQLLVDVHQVTGQRLEQCFQEARELQKWMSTTVRQSLQFNQTNDFVKLNSKSILSLEKRIDSVLKEDFMQNMLLSTLGDRAGQHFWGEFYLLRNHPMLLGLIVQSFLGEIHEIGITMSGDQGAILTTVHLYNALQRLGTISKNLVWTDVEKLISWQGPSLIFVGDRPENPRDCLVRHALAIGISVTALSRDQQGRPAARLAKNKKQPKLPLSPGKLRKLKLMSTYFWLQNEEYKTKGRSKGKRWILTRAATEPLVMLEMLVAKVLKEETVTTTRSNSKRPTHPKLDPLDMIRVFKDRLKSEEEIPLFDLLALNRRCVELLRKFQKICLDQSPLDYPVELYGGDGKLWTCVTGMMEGELGREHQQPTRVLEASSLVKELIENFGEEEYGKAKSRCFITGDCNEKVAEPFPTHDVPLLSERFILPT
ncbi:hypothetical protein HYFRA_00003560 [Hymenoscyphus fraxineus]|uniref:DUF6604 domain-containing protein n=1 Tax=Hymenoscyphus fraxineus TaxID=746836 RepID=A0A9N9KTT8_9HELO|nr:hypothetical protein HYFRA_00003560 [Hymenoscyphus fraxineus]